jgi:hypothetical protein
VLSIFAVSDCKGGYKMGEYSRRQILKHIGASAAFLLMSRNVLSLPNNFFSADSQPFEMLVVGDSHVSGQGLLEKNKFYYLVKNGCNEKFSAHPDRSISKSKRIRVRGLNCIKMNLKRC